VPFGVFKMLLKLIEDDQVFGSKYNAANTESIPDAIKLLGALRTLGISYSYYILSNMLYL